MNFREALKNSQGKIFYGMHFYPGVAQYETDEGSYRVFVNEDTIRKMNPSFAGRPVFVEHVEGVEQDVDTLRNDADGWVVESFFNAADGKTWVKFLICSEDGFQAIRKGFKLSNAYLPELSDTKATWNGVDYQKIVTGGEFEHLAIVDNPRYEESVIMTPDEFKAYNENLNVELKRLANSKDKKGDHGMKFFKKEVVKNSIDLDGTIVELPKSKKEMTLAKVLNEYDAILNMNGYANGDHMVKVGDKDEMSVNDLVKKHQDMCNEMADLKKNAAGDEGGEPGTGEDDIDPEVANSEEVEVELGGEGERDDNGDKSLDNEEDEDDAEEKKKKDKKVNAIEKAKAARIAAARLANAHKNARDEAPVAKVYMSQDQVARGRDRYGSN